MLGVVHIRIVLAVEEFNVVMGKGRNNETFVGGCARHPSSFALANYAGQAGGQRDLPVRSSDRSEGGCVSFAISFAQKKWQSLLPQAGKPPIGDRKNPGGSQKMVLKKAPFRGPFSVPFGTYISFLTDY